MIARFTPVVEVYLKGRLLFDCREGRGVVRKRKTKKTREKKQDRAFHLEMFE